VEPAEQEKVVVLDFGSQYSQLIARRVRERKVFCEILPNSTSAEELRHLGIKGIIFSGGPASAYAPDAPGCDPQIFQLGLPIFGICYGMQLGVKMLGGTVSPAAAREYGRTQLQVTNHNELFFGLPSNLVVWMSHGDQVDSIGGDFEELARTENCPFAALRHRSIPFYGVQFHPEVAHTSLGSEILGNFLMRVCKCSGKWQMSSYVKKKVKEIRSRVGDGTVLCALSGGVDSAVTATLVQRAVGKQLVCIFVNNGLLRKGEPEQVVETFQKFLKMDLRVVDARERFLEHLKGITEPEEKRKVIGHEFISVFRKEAAKIPGARFLAQGTLYPDVIESRSAWGGPSATIKTHHNVGGLPPELGFELIEPLRELFKDEVRQLGRELGLPEEIVTRQPFPGPGLAVRILGEVTPERIRVLQDADAIVVEEIRKAGLYKRIWQSFAILLPVSSVGVMGDERTYENVIALRAVESSDGMTADWVHLPYELLGRISNRLINEVKGVNRVVYDISSKPPSTIEWE